ncbi:MAG: GNAT family N-acetyltransferase [Anaerovoracaceae bacterium]|jgi:ribosomal protein S18 acetylase RimI-like enzyme
MDMKYLFRKAAPKDIDAVAEIYDKIHTAEESGELRIGWARGVYPIRDTAEDAVRRGDLFLELSGDNVIVGSAIINQIQVDSYREIPWSADPPEDQIMVIHTLVIPPEFGRHGYGEAFVDFYERYAWEKGAPYLRLDTNRINQSARSMYRKHGYREAGIVPCTFNGIEGVELVCLEKHLERKP